MRAARSRVAQSWHHLQEETSSLPQLLTTLLTNDQTKDCLEKQLLGHGFFWGNSSCTLTIGDNPLLPQGLSKEQGEQSVPNMGQEEGDCCLLTRENLSGTLELLQPQLIDVQLEGRSSNHERLLFAMKLLLNNSKGPESRSPNSLHTEKTERLTREYSRDRKRDDCHSRGDTALCPAHS